MGLLPLLFALGETITDTIREKREHFLALEEQQRYEDIDFDNIAYVTLDNVKQAYRTETEEEFDPVMSNFLTEQDGWAHYETKTVEYEVEDGANYCFTIHYKNDTEIYRVFHESNPLTQRLLEYCHQSDISAQVAEVNEAIDDVIVALNNLFTPQSTEGNYETAFSNFKKLQMLYGLNADSTQEDFEKAVEIRMTSLITANEYDYQQSLYELMLYLLSTKEDGDILEKTDKDGFSFLQQTEKGLDAFAILPKDQELDYPAVCKYYNALTRNKYRKALILTTSVSKVISFPEVIIWDMEKICAAYLTAFKKIVAEEETVEEAVQERYAVIDFETTGVNYKSRYTQIDEILSVAIIDQDENVLLDTYCDTVNVKTWYEAQRVNGISPSDVRGYPTFVEIMPKVIEILSSYDYVLAYNIPFEKGFLESYAHRYTPTDFTVQNIKWGADPMQMFMNHIGSDRFQKLQTAADYFGYRYNAHNALEDTKATLYIYKLLNK